MDTRNRDEPRPQHRASRRRRSSAGQALCFVLACAASQDAGAPDRASLLDLAFDAPTVTPALRELPDGRTVIADEVLIVLERGAHRTGVEEQLEELEMVVLGSVPTLGVYRIGLPPSQADEVSLGRLRRIPGVESAEWHGMTQPAEDPANPDDTWFDQQWHHTVPDFSGATPSENSGGIATQVAWQLTHGSADVMVAVLNSGIVFDHPEFVGRLMPGHDFVDEDDDPTAHNMHGVRVALVLAANGDNAFGTVGVDQACRLLPVRVSKYGSGTTTFDFVQGVDFAVRQGADVINVSLYLGSDSDYAERKSLFHAEQNGVLVVKEAGNFGTYWPADEDDVSADPFTITVGATDRHGVLAGFSASGTAVDFVAPGAGIVTSWPFADGQDSTITVQGTSYATALTTGVISLMKSIHPGLTRQQAYDALRASAIDSKGDPATDTPGWDEHHGHGLINAAKALDALCACLGEPSFYSSPQDLELAHGGTVSFTIDAGSGLAGGRYLLLGSVSGSSPGSPLGATTWPIAPDAYTYYSILHANELPWIGNFGPLDADGRATASLVVPPLLPDLLGGTTVLHAAAVWSDGGAHPLVVPATQVSAPRALQLRQPSQVHFSEDFEGFLLGWTGTWQGAATWHLVPDGTCGAATRMMAFNEPGTCTFTPGAPSEARLVSPSFALGNASPFTIEFDMLRDFVAGSQSLLGIDVVDDSASAPLLTQQIGNYRLTNGEWGVGPVHVRLEVPQSSKFEDRTVHLEFVGRVDEPAGGTGWLIDNLIVRDAGALP
jgi:hypothetical protein